MCGIFGTVCRNIGIEEVVPHLLHRGPDAQSSWNDDCVGLHHFRLSILDIGGGIQPMHRGDFVVIFNGELYNHNEVRAKYSLVCSTKSDTETLLAAYEKLGDACFAEFDGMFALCIYNKRTHKMVLARDRAGKKPLYIYHDDKEIVFSSELKAMSKTMRLEPDYASIDAYFKGAFIGRSTPYKNIQELPGGYLAHIDTATTSIDIKQWWTIDDFYSKPSDDTYAISEDKVKNYLSQAVNRRIDSSDLEVGAFLSGGIDSGLVVAAAAERYDRLKTFTVAMPGAYNEAPLAKKVAEKFATDHTEISINFDTLRQDFESIVLNYGEPFIDSSAIPSYYVSREAKKYVTVVLNGDGADELFGGYRRYVAANKFDFYTSKSKGLWRTMLKFMPIAHEKKSKYNYAYRLVNTLGMPPEKAYWALTLDMFSGHDDAFVNSAIDNSFIENFVDKYQRWHPLHKQMGLDFYILLQGILLKKMDIATMAHSLEGRSPFLCKELLEYTPTMNPAYKIKGTTTKVILRNIAKQWLPEELFSQPKRGFEIPLKKWMDNELHGFVHEYLDNTGTFVGNFVKHKFIGDVIHRRVKMSDEKRAKILYKLLVTEIWARENRFV